MKAIVLREIKDRRYSLLSYCAIVIILMLVYVSIFPSVQASMAQFQKIYESYPKGLYKALGIENLSINNIENYLAIELYSIVWPILALLLSISLAGFTIAGQIERGFLGFYLALPIGRIKLFLAKYISGLTSAVVFTLVSVGGVIPLAALFGNPVNAGNVLRLGLLSLLFMWATFAVSMFLSALFSERSKVYMVMGGGLIAMYAANVIAGLKVSLSWLSNYSIFHYYNAQSVLSNGALRTSSLIIFSLAIVVFTILGFLAFSKRDVAV